MLGPEGVLQRVNQPAPDLLSPLRSIDDEEQQFRRHRRLRLTIADRRQSVVDDVERIRKHPLVPGSIPVYGFVYDVRSGPLEEIPEATEAGKAS